MEGITNNQTVSATQLGLFESIADLLLIDPIFIFGIVLIAVPLMLICKKEGSVHKGKMIFLSLVMFINIRILFIIDLLF